MDFFIIRKASILQIYRFCIQYTHSWFPASPIRVDFSFCNISHQVSYTYFSNRFIASCTDFSSFGTPVFLRCSFPTSNCGLKRRIISVVSCASERIASRISKSEMKEASQTMISYLWAPWERNCHAPLAWAWKYPWGEVTEDWFSETPIPPAPLSQGGKKSRISVSS